MLLWGKKLGSESKAETFARMLKERGLDAHARGSSVVVETVGDDALVGNFVSLGLRAGRYFVKGAT